MTDLPLMTYVATMSVTPGPNNLMLAASGVNFGFRRTLPHLLGVCLGCSLQVLVVASLLAYVMVWLEAARIWLLLSGCSYLLWLAWRQAQAGQPGKRKVSQPLGFIGAALFQWVNPKAWMMVLNSAIVFLPPNGGVQAALSMALIFVLINLPCISIWALIGDRLRDCLREPKALRLFNYSMALLLAATGLWILLEETLKGSRL